MPKFGTKLVEKRGICGIFFKSPELHLTSEIHLEQGLGPKDPGISEGRDFPYNPILGMGLEPSILF